MEGLCKFYKARDPPIWTYAVGEDSENISVSEIRSYHNQTSKSMQTYSVPSANLGAWLDNASRSASGDDADSTRVAMVWVPLRKVSTRWQLGLQQRSFELVLQKFMIEDAFQYSYFSSAGMAASPTGNCANQETCSYCLFMHQVFILAWSHNSARGTSQGVCLVYLSVPWILSTFQALLENQMSMASHPMFLAAVAGLLLEYSLGNNLRGHGHDISTVEARTGYHQWIDLSAGAAEGDYAVLSAKTSGYAAALANEKRLAKVLREIMEFISQRLPQNGSGGASATFQHQDAESTMKECLAVLKGRLTMDEIMTDLLLHRTQIQIAALFNLIAQKDATLNIALAKDSRTLASASKRDSSAMKTLAAVTVAFLPGTFISSLFAMPLLDWNAGRNDAVVSRKFWIYWAFTIPLTLVTMAIWLLWTHRQTLLHRAQDRRARDQLDEDIREERDGKMGEEV